MPHTQASRHQDFETLTDRIFIYTPPDYVLGELVIICTWLGALPKHSAKYIQLYQQIAHGARILLVESDVSVLTSRYAYQQRIIQPAVSVVLDTIANRSNPRILIHTFSNGGTNTASQLLIVTQERRSAPLPIYGIVFDSGPTRERYQTNVNAMVASLPKNPIAQFLGSIACHSMMIILHTWIYFGNEPPADLQRRIMLDSSIVEAEPEGTRTIGYIFSKADRFCEWTDIADHAKQARELGWEAEEVPFNGSAHCQHFSKDPKTYAEVVSRVWGGDGGGIRGGRIGENPVKALSKF